MKQMREFIDDYSAEFTQVGAHDEEELRTSGPRNDENAALELDALSCLRFFPHVTNLILKPGQISQAHLPYLYHTPAKRLKLDYDSDSQDEYTMDLGKFPGLECVFSLTEFNFQNVQNCKELHTLTVQKWYTSDLRQLAHGKLTSLKILSGKLTSLSSLHRLHELKSLSVSNQRSLTCIADLAACPVLEHLEIDSCSRLDLQAIPELPQLKSLVLIGRQTIGDCAFFSRFPNLERLILGVKILDGDLSPLLKLKHCTILTDHRHYSHKNAALPKDPS